MSPICSSSGRRGGARSRRPYGRRRDALAPGAPIPDRECDAGSSWRCARNPACRLGHTIFKRLSMLFLENQVHARMVPWWKVLLFATALSLLTGVAFGSIPAFRATLVYLTPALKQASAGAIPRGVLMAQGTRCGPDRRVGGAGLRRRPPTQRANLKRNGGFETKNVLVFHSARVTRRPLERMTGLCTETIDCAVRGQPLPRHARR